MIISIDDKTQLELTDVKHAASLFEAVNNNRRHLSEFLPWVKNMQSVDDFKAYLKNCELMYKQKTEISFVIMHNKAASGRIGLHYINPLNKSAAIGYWLSKDAQGSGIITKSCIALLNYGFKELRLHRIEIKAAAKNIKSQAIPERLHFTKEGILREAEFVNNRFHDLVIYSILSHEWEKKKK